MARYKISLFVLACIICVSVAYGMRHKLNLSFNRASVQDSDQDIDSANKPDLDEEATPSSPVPITEQDLNSTPKDTSALGGYDVLIADRGNNRIIEVTPDKKIVWEYHFNLPKLGLGADDAFFTDGGKSIIVNLEEYHLIEIIDYATKQVVWSYGVPGKPGNATGMLNTPDDAYKLSNGDVITADIKNCRVIEINPNKQIVHQYGQTGKCGDTDGLLDKPNGDTPLANGHILVSNIVGKNLVELDSDWKPVFTMLLPVKYPSDPQLTKAGNILISDYSRPGQIVEVSKQGKIVWQFEGQPNDVKLEQPSLAIELPNGNILCNDDSNQRVIVINKQTKKIVWQYGVTDKPGSAPGQLSIPDGVSIIMRDQGATNSEANNALSVGQVSRHATSYLNQNVTVTGYVLAKENGYDIFSDESSGTIGYYDLPVSGAGVENLALKQKYTIQGVLKPTVGIINPINKNPNYLELTNILQ